MQEKLISVAKGAGIAAAGAVLSYFAHWAAGEGAGPYGPIIAAACAVAINALRKLSQEEKKSE